TVGPQEPRPAGHRRNGGLIAGTMASIANGIKVPNANINTSFNLGGYVVTGTNWRAAGISRPASQETVGAVVLYGESGPAPTVSPVPAGATGFSYPTPIKLSATLDDPGVNYCPPGLIGKCRRE